MTEEQITEPPTTPPENPAKSVREWESFFVRCGGEKSKPAKTATEIDLFE